MQAFGIEIRKSNSLGNLYQDVDRTLANSGILPGQAISKNVQVQAVAHALQKMIRVENYFSVCTIDSCIDVAQIHVPKERYSVYRTAHCINWNDMTPDYRQILIAMVLDDFRSILCTQ
jgi:hypothetical protein